MSTSLPSTAGIPACHGVSDQERNQKNLQKGVDKLLKNFPPLAKKSGVGNRCRCWYGGALMKLKVNRIGAVTTCWLAAIALVCGATAVSAQETKIQGLITSRDGANMTIRTAAGNNTVVTLTDATKVDEKEGKALHLRKKEMAVVALVPGLRVDVQAEGSGKTLTAKSVTFSGKDLEQAQAIQAGLSPTQQQVNKNKQGLATADQKIDTNAAEIAKNTADESDLAKRFGELSDYDTKREATVYFDSGKTDVSASGKKDLDTVAQQAKALNGYLIEVEGFADASGNAAQNEKLSLERSQAVIDYLTGSGGISPLHLLAPGAMGTSQPVASNETAAGRAENRRVVVKVLVNRGLSKQ
jgi:OmpA-OmpF porin, OOP family